MNADFQTLITSRYPNEFKKKVILYAERHSNSEAERVFGIAESNIRRWRKLKSLIFSKHFVSDSNRKSRLSRKVEQNHDDFIHEIEKLDNMMESSKKWGSKDPLSRLNFITSPPTLSPALSQSTKDDKEDSDTEEVCLRWNSHHSNMKLTFPTLLQKEQYVDVTLTAEGKSVKCHRLVLSSCSSYFDEILNGISPTQHPVIFLTGVSFCILKCLMDFMYAGELHIEQHKLENLLKVAEMLQIKGLTGKTASQQEEQKVVSPPPMVQIKGEKSTPEPRAPTPKRDVPTPPATAITTTNTKSPVKKAVSPVVVTRIDPLSLLEPTFFEENPVPLRFKEPISKKVTKKLKKRRSEHELSPPPLLYRKGTKSRPHVKIPSHYQNDFQGLGGNLLREKVANTEVPDISNIKIESLIIETTDLDNFDKRKYNKEMMERMKTKRQMPELFPEMQEESKLKENFPTATQKSFKFLLDEIKEEQIDVSDTELNDSGDQNSTI